MTPSAGRAADPEHTLTTASARTGAGLPRLILLIGYRGAGKTTVAELLARQLDWNCIDADAVLEARAGQSIRDIFAREGEAGFRDREAAILNDLCQLERHVIATGGGAVLRIENQRRLRSAGYCIWLTADATTLWQRLQSDPATPERRPALTTGGLSEIEEVLRARDPLYRACADWTLPTAGRSPQEIVSLIVEHLQIPAAPP